MKNWVLTLPLRGSILLLSKRLRRCNHPKVISYLSELHLKKRRVSITLLFFCFVVGWISAGVHPRPTIKNGRLIASPTLCGIAIKNGPVLTRSFFVVLLFQFVCNVKYHGAERYQRAFARFFGNAQVFVCRNRWLWGRSSRHCPQIVEDTQLWHR